MTSLDSANAAFWNELCGSHLARILGIEDSSPKSLAKYDDWYFNYYPYILEVVQREKPTGKRVLEIGLGYGSLGQRIAESGADYCGLDVSPGPVAMMRHRLNIAGLHGSVYQFAFPNNDFEHALFDLIVSIGCFHHSGNTSGCVSELLRLLRPGGTALVMVYNRHSYRHFFEQPLCTVLSGLRDFLGLSPLTFREADAFLCRYDSNGKGKTAPHTEFLGRRQVKRLFHGFRTVEVWKENCADEKLFGKWFKRETLRPYLGPLAGTDLYIRAVK